MQIHSLNLKNFNKYTALDWAPPVSGLTLITGDNGSGKSTVIEGVCWALYGETVRGKSPQPPGPGKTTARLEFEARGHRWVVERERQATVTKVTWTCNGRDMSGQTATDTQGKIDALLGGWERFTATAIFAKEFLAKFGASTDKERKELLEGMLGLERFGQGLDVARAKLNVFKDLVARTAGQLQALDQRLQSHEALTDLPTTRALGQVAADITAAREEVNLVQTAHARLKQAINGIDLDRRAQQTRRANASAAANHAAQNQEKASRKAVALHAKAECPTCYQGIGPEGKARIAEVLGAEAEKHRVEHDKLKVEADAAAAEEQELDDERNGLTKQWEVESSRAVKAREAISLLTTEQREIELVTQMRQAREAQANELQQERAATAALQAKQHAQADILSAVAAVYGTRGARHMLLGRALRQLEHASNQVLRQIGLDIQVQITPTTTLKNGKASDTISVTLSGDLSGEYGGASSGERSRVDVALLLGLATMQGDSNALGWIAFDEVFDALDSGGISQVAAYLGTLAQDRQVLVISHNEEAQALFPRATVLKAVKDPALGSSLEAP